jgi:hypothetical protein
MSGNGQDLMNAGVEDRGPRLVPPSPGPEQAATVEVARSQTGAGQPPGGQRSQGVGAEPVVLNDPWIYRMIVLVLGIVLIVATSGGILIAMAGKSSVPDVVVALGSGAVGALAGLLAPSPGARQ